MTTLRLDKLNLVWDGIKKGELKHDQTSFFCGTSACVAGWIVASEAIEMGFKLGDSRCPFTLGYAVCRAVGVTDFWEYARELIGLSQLEAILIFSVDAEIKIQQDTIDALNSGNRFGVDKKIKASESIDYQKCVSIAGLT